MTTAPPLGRDTLLALLAMAAGVFLLANDFTSLSVALTTLETEFGTTLSEAQWVVNGYTVVFGVLIVTGGKLADMYGRRRIFLIGATIFATFSVAGAFSPTIEILIASRALMGIGGALMWPAILGMTYSILPPERAGLAGALILGVAGLGNAFGPMLGGIVTDTIGWPWLFIINVPVTVVAVLITLRFVPESGAGGERGIDVPGIAALSIGVVAILVALDEGSSVGYGDPLILGLLVVGVVALIAFAFIERRQGAIALVPMDLVRNRTFIAAAGAVLLVSAIFFAALVYLPQLMQKDLGFDAIGAGVGLLPMMGAFTVTSFASGPLYDRLGGRIVVSAGAAALAIGMVLLGVVDATSGYAVLVPGMLVVGVGIGLFYSSITTTAVTSVDASQSSLAGGIIYMCQIAGGSVGLGLNTAIVVAAPSLEAGVSAAFLVDAALAFGALVLILATIGRGTVPRRHVHLPHLHRAHAP